MEEQQDSRSCLVVWRGRKFVVEINPSATLKELGGKLQELTNVKADTLRLLVPKKWMCGEDLHSLKIMLCFYDNWFSASIFQGKSIRMMGVPKDEVDEVLENAKVDLRIAGFDEEEKRLKQRNADRAYTSQKLPQGTYIFCDFRTLSLPGIELNPPASKALDLLHKLATDPGIVAIMNKHRWRVGILTEMAPIGYVGVSPKCILGVNKNHGEEISLRLRTDDLKGFRKYESIKKTLLHELAHMVFSEHDANFYALDSQLNKEAATLDWTKSRGHTLTGATRSQHYEDEFDVSTDVTSHKLGGQASILPNARLSSVNAAFERLANISTTLSSSSEEPNAVPEPDPDDRDDDDDDKSMVLEPCEESNPDNSGVNPIGLDSCAEVQRKSVELPSHVSSAPIGHDPNNSHVEEMQTERGSVEARPMSQTSLKYEVKPSEAAIVLQTFNVIEHPDDMKFKRLRKVSLLRRLACGPSSAMEILSMIGEIISQLTSHDNKSKFRLTSDIKGIRQKSFARTPVIAGIHLRIKQKWKHVRMKNFTLLNLVSIKKSNNGVIVPFLLKIQNIPGLLLIAKNTNENCIQF
ncbi:hypothetical protein BUALT_BualtUnG0059800 [Buddleja alternifolia]|uniref:WLM domain-containing protein n=1 Tax=Buddleja alternifolia TaxID=168488 RepID=A0AAV6W5U1_9LAMI|nr:hypothetical protein BUALT_BualtUnG0059800 [Buddleja alternifolia]